MALNLVVREYLKKMLMEAGSGMKVLLVDQDTMAVVSSVYTQSEILQKEVFLVEYLDGGHSGDKSDKESLQHMKGVAFLRPTLDNFTLLRRHLRNPKYGEYHLFFSNMVRDAFLHELAEADTHDLVKQVHEYFADFVPLDGAHFTLPPAAVRRARDHIVEGLSSIMLATKRRPLIRYQSSSEHARSVALDMWRLMYEQEVGLFDFRRGSGVTVLLIVDRLDDAVTPLLTQWTYQAMVHELIGIHNHRVDLRALTGKASKDQGEIVLSPLQDSFFEQHMFDNYGDLGQAVKGMVDAFQAESKSNTSISSIEDMQRFVENYPEFRSRSGQVSKHVTLLSELNRMIDKRRLMTASMHEQELACASNMTGHHTDVMTLLNDPSIDENNKLRLVMLFALRYEQDGGARELTAKLYDRLGAVGVPRKDVALVAGLLKLAGAERRTGDLYGTKTFSARASKMVSSLKGVENVYTQHQPLLMQTLENLAKGKLKEGDYPTVGSSMQTRDRPNEVVVFSIGGTTYEESRSVAQYNAAAAKDGGMRVILGGTFVHNSDTFLAHVAEQMRANDMHR